MKRISIQVACKDRHSELALLIQSLRTQTYQAWDLIVWDECQTPIEQNYFLSCLLNRIKLENHYVNIITADVIIGVCNARNKLLELDYFDNPYIARLDDDVIIEPDYLQKLIDVINQGYDIASGITPVLGGLNIARDIDTVEPIINKLVFNDDGDIIEHNDNCGYGYNEEKILPANEFRSCALMKAEIGKKIKYETNLSPTGFREEAFYSLRAQWAGYKIGVHTGAFALHLCSPTGGCRSQDYAERVKSDNEYFLKWAKKMYKENGALHKL